MGQLQQHPLPVGPEPVSREWLQNGRGDEPGGAQLLGVSLFLQQPIGLDTQRPVAGTPTGPVGAAHQGVGASNAMSLLVRRKRSADDHGGAGVHRIQGLGRVSLSAQIDHVSGTAEGLQHGIAELRAARERLQQRLVERFFGFRGAGVEGVEGLDGAASCRVRIQQKCHFQARCRATMPPVRFFHSTPRQPQSAIRSASSFCAGQARIDSAR